VSTAEVEAWSEIHDWFSVDKLLQLDARLNSRPVSAFFGQEFISSFPSSISKDWYPEWLVSIELVLVWRRLWLIVARAWNRCNGREGEWKWEYEATEPGSVHARKQKRHVTTFIS